MDLIFRMKLIYQFTIDKKNTVKVKDEVCGKITVNYINFHYFASLV